MKSLVRKIAPLRRPLNSSGSTLTRQIAKSDLISSFHQNTFECFANAVAGSPIRVHPHMTNSLLSSASLACNYIRNWYTRNDIHFPGSAIKDILKLVQPGSGVWSVDDSNFQRFHQRRLERRVMDVNRELAYLREKQKYCGNSQDKIDELSLYKDRLQLFIGSIKEKQSLNIHPTNSMNSTNSSVEDHTTEAGPSKSDSEIEDLDSTLKLGKPFPPFRGIFFRILGPDSKGDAFEWEASAGKHSMNSEDFVFGEAANMQILTVRRGTYGLRLRLVYGLKRGGLFAMPEKVCYDPIQGTWSHPFKVLQRKIV